MRSKNMNSIVVHISSWHTKWIIGGIFREASEACSIKPTWRVYSNSKRDVLNLYVLKSRINPAVGKLNIYAHQDTYFSIFSRMPAQITNTRNRVFFTHFNEGQTPTKQQINSLQYCEKILVQNEAMENFLTSEGISKDRIFRAPGAVSRATYKPSSNLPECKFVLFSGDFKYRKNPDLIAQVITSMPDINFVVHGQNWEIFSSEFLYGLPNLKRLNFDLKNQPQLMRQASLYVSLALIEGGPFPVLEALASGTPVVATDTGFCAEFIKESNGRLLPNPPEPDLVMTCIRQALEIKRSVWNQDLLHGAWQWKELGELIYG